MTTQQKPGCLAALLSWFGLEPEPEEEEPLFSYHVRDDFLSPAEISFYHVLTTLVGDGAVVCRTVPLGDPLYAATGEYGQNRSCINRIDRKHVDRKHVDFLLCDPGSMRPILAVELDDAPTNEPTARSKMPSSTTSSWRLTSPYVRSLAASLLTTTTAPGSTRRFRALSLSVPQWFNCPHFHRSPKRNRLATRPRHGTIAQLRHT